MSIFFCTFVRLLCAKMNMRKILYLFYGLSAVLLVSVSCQKHTYDFSYSPNGPKAGQTVTFTNLSDAGENWVWAFGDGSKSTLKNPTHVYTAAGTYVVELMVDSTKSRTVSHVLEVQDSIPSIYVASDIVQQYAPITIKASFYNPTKTSVIYEWELDEQLFNITDGDLTSDSITGYFTDYGRTTDIRLTITIGSKTTVAERTLTLTDNDAPSLMMLTDDGQLWRQRIYDGIYESAKPYDGDKSVIAAANDSTATLNGINYDIHNMPVLTDKQISALQVDAVNRKLYLILNDGVYVANANGDALTLIAETEAQTLLIDGERNTIYWSDSEGVQAMPLVTNPQNTISEQLRSKIHTVNTVAGVQRMLINR